MVARQNYNPLPVAIEKSFCQPCEEFFRLRELPPLLFAAVFSLCTHPVN